MNLTIFENNKALLVILATSVLSIYPMILTYKLLKNEKIIN